MAVALVLVAGALLAPAASAAQPERPRVDVIQIGGLLDRVQADFWLKALRDAERADSRALVVQIDSPRSVLDIDRYNELLVAVVNATVPVAIWIGPPRNGHLGRDGVPLWTGADARGLAPGASVDGLDRLERDGVPFLRSPTLGDFIVSLDGQKTKRGRTIDIPSHIVRDGKVPQQVPDVTVHFDKPGLLARTIHGVTGPGPAYGLLVFGLLLAVLEFTTAGVGLAAITGALLLGLGALGLGGLPVNGLGVAALVVAVFGLSVDLQAGAPRAWTAIGTAGLVFGTLNLYRDGMDVPLAWAVAVIALTLVFMIAGLPALVRSRFSTPTIGRDGFIGEQGTAVGAVDPEGVVEVLGASWRARTNRATPIAAGEAVRVVAIDGLLLEVEPETGAARDYRERRAPAE
ncbi:MAG TPA: NfeD family protein [Acidimicrobiales bacterium]|nr:NfeD family protein [Acidimicrobiales bacterium]